MDRLFQWLFGFLALLVLGVTTVSATTLWSVRIANEIKHHFGFSILVGIIALALIPLLAMVLATTLIGLPLALVVFALLGAALLLSGVFVSLRIGSWIMDRAQRSSASPHARLATGALLLSFVAALPWIGWLAWVVVPIVGVGALVLERRDAWQQACAVRVT